ncbi:MAG: nicotinate phosphoribosyltransferase [Coriobacteriaceae bacterium]|nr:nicotinate phosphoribosyltransferase [Coriobacteriaceae bacterium]MDY3799962.1 nicotinate phosphoribosyltransferase [Eggerthellaceae bacterium]MDY4986799.1 nicotinate phosphoribosyltransferase [Eggerthellaceae bacterium]
MNPDFALLTDLYQLTMAQGYWKTGLSEDQACFHMYFRDNPFSGGYSIACGMAQLAELVDGFRFSGEDCEYLAGLKAPGGGALFEPEFLEWLGDLRLSVDIDAVHEGTVVFPNEPLVRVTGPIMQCQLLETALLNCVNFETLIATKAARVCLAAESPVAEFGLRRAQGYAGGVWASRAAVVGGCASTSNVLAGKLFGLPVSGTHAHSWVMAFESELEAFRAYARAFPNNCILLIDTYDVRQGLENAITVGLEMKQRGERLIGVRIDSGDLSWLAKMCRERLDEAGLSDCGVVLSNDLDEYTISSIRNEGAQVMSWGVGTKLATAYDQPTLGGVYKLSATRAGKDAPWVDRIKIAENSSKLTFPGVLGIRRYYHEDGFIAGDMVYDVNAPINGEERIVDPMDQLRQKVLSGKRFEELLHPLARNGKSVLEPCYRDALAAAERVRQGLENVHETQKRMLNPHSYPVGLECGLAHRRLDLVASRRDIK